VTRRQLLDAGLSDDAISHRVRTGRLHRVHVGVYSVGRPAVTALERASAAVLACGPNAALSHFSALALWGLAKRWPSRVDVLVPDDRRRPDISVHRSKSLGRRDLRTRQGIRVTSPARTLLDNTPRLTDKVLARAVNDARLQHHLRPAQLTDILNRCPTHPGAKRLGPFADPLTGPTRSELEDAFLNFCRRYELPRPKVNPNVGGYEVDAYFEAEDLIVELDSYAYHSDRTAFERDRTRDLDAKADGRDTVRITHRHITEQPERSAKRLHTILERRRGQPRV
jgi:predicted transcriptional regulator of viral defense system